MSANIKHKRLIKAIGLLIVFIVFALFLNSLIKSISLFSNIDIVLNHQNEFPENFTDNFFDTKNMDYKNLRINNDKHIISFLLSSNAQESFYFVKNRLTNNGWIYIPSNSETCASFEKQNCDINWLFLNCTQIESDTNVVMTIN